MSDDRIIVTGCSGFVGRNIVKTLLHKGFDVIGFSRTNPQIERLQFIEFDLTDERKFNTDEFRHTTIINTAAITRGNDLRAYEETNYKAVLRLLGLNPEGKFIHISSSSIYDLGKPSNMTSEDEFSLTGYKLYNPYSLYKAKAEEALISGVVPRQIQPISLRPHAVYGEDDTTLMPALEERVKRGRLFLPRGGEVQHSLTHISNLVQAVELSLSHNNEKPEAFNVTDSESTTIAYAIKSALGAHIQIKGIPTSILLSKVGKMLRVSEYEIRQLGFDRTYNLSKAKLALGYRPTPFNEDWLRN